MKPSPEQMDVWLKTSMDLLIRFRDWSTRGCECIIPMDGDSGEYSEQCEGCYALELLDKFLDKKGAK